MRNRVLLILLFLLIALPESLLATEAVFQNEEVVVQFEKPLENAAKEVADIYPAVKAELENTFKWRLDFRPTIILIKDSKTFQKIVESGLVVAVAVPQKNLIVINNSKMNVHPFTLEITLKHELCHLMLHHHISEGNLPKWLNEGISQWSSGGVAEIIMGESRDVLKQASLSGEFISLRGLTDKFPGDERAVLLAYEESKSIVEYIIREFGASGLLQVLSYLRDGDDIDTAIFKGLSLPLQELENRWHDYLRKRTTWFIYFSNNLYNILFFLAGLILTYGFIRFLLKKKAYKDGKEDMNNT